MPMKTMMSQPETDPSAPRPQSSPRATAPAPAHGVSPGGEGKEGDKGQPAAAAPLIRKQLLTASWFPRDRFASAPALQRLVFSHEERNSRGKMFFTCRAPRCHRGFPRAAGSCPANSSPRAHTPFAPSPSGGPFAKLPLPPTDSAGRPEPGSRGRRTDPREGRRWRDEPQPRPSAEPRGPGPAPSFPPRTPPQARAPQRPHGPPRAPGPKRRDSPGAAPQAAAALRLPLQTCR